MVSLLTREHGLLRASARSARVEASKLRYGLEPLTYGMYSLVRGKREWRLIGAERLSRECISTSAARRRVAGRVLSLLLRLIQGEEPIAGLYTVVVEGLACLARATNEQEAEALECVIVLRSLAHLGYLPTTPALSSFIEETYSVELAARALESRALIVRTINESLSATGL
jgi:recombinational DNA repair protein (RecF pathway)